MSECLYLWRGVTWGDLIRRNRKYDCWKKARTEITISGSAVTFRCQIPRPSWIRTRTRAEYEYDLVDLYDLGLNGLAHVLCARFTGKFCTILE
jgi:hypothetical protein